MNRASNGAYDLNKIAAALQHAKMTRQAIPPLSETYPALSIESSYRISQINHEAALALGDREFGRKIGLTSPRVQAQLGVHQPDFGYLRTSMQIEDGGRVSVSKMLFPKCEAEVAFLIGRDLDHSGITETEIRASTEAIFCSIEIIDSRIQDWKIKITDTIADNASSAYFVLSQGPIALGSLDLKNSEMQLKRNGEIVSTGNGSLCLGDPLRSTAWLANEMVRLGTPLRAGQIVLSGAFGPVIDVRAGDLFEAEIDDVGRTSVRFTE